MAYFIKIYFYFEVAELYNKQYIILYIELLFSYYKIFVRFLLGKNENQIFNPNIEIKKLDFNFNPNIAALDVKLAQF